MRTLCSGVLWRHTGEHAAARHSVQPLPLSEPVRFGACQNRIRVRYPRAGGNRAGCLRMILGDHDWPDSRRGELIHHVRRIGLHHVRDRHQSGQGQIMSHPGNVLGIGGADRPVQRGLRDREHPQAAPSEAADRGGAASACGQPNSLPAFAADRDHGALAKQDLRSPFHHQRARQPAEARHPLASRARPGDAARRGGRVLACHCARCRRPSPGWSATWPGPG